MINEHNLCQHCHERFQDDQLVDLIEEVGDIEFHGYTCLCIDCFEVVEDEFGDLSHIIPNQSEFDF